MVASSKAGQGFLKDVLARFGIDGEESGSLFLDDKKVSGEKSLKEFGVKQGSILKLVKRQKVCLFHLALFIIIVLACSSPSSDTGPIEHHHKYC